MLPPMLRDKTAALREQEHRDTRDYRRALPCEQCKFGHRRGARNGLYVPGGLRARPVAHARHGPHSA
jgi:hypothetical protein